MILTDKYVDFLLRHNMTPNEFLLLVLLYEKKTALVGKIQKEVLNGKPYLPKERIEEFIKRGYLVKTQNGYQLGRNFTDTFVDGNKATEEFYNAYPDFMRTKEGVQIPLTGMDRETFKRIYMAKIHHSVDEHLEIIKDVQYGANQNMINMGINKFLSSEQWRALRKLRKQQQTHTGYVAPMDKDF